MKSYGFVSFLLLAHKVNRKSSQIASRYLFKSPFVLFDLPCHFYQLLVLHLYNVVKPFFFIFLQNHKSWKVIKKELNWQLTIIACDAHRKPPSTDSTNYLKFFLSLYTYLKPKPQPVCRCLSSLLHVLTRQIISREIKKKLLVCAVCFPKHCHRRAVGLTRQIQVSYFGDEPFSTPVNYLTLL